MPRADMYTSLPTRLGACCWTRSHPWATPQAPTPIISCARQTIVTGGCNCPQASLSLVRVRRTLPDLASAQALVMEPSVWSWLVMRRDWLIVGSLGGGKPLFFLLLPLWPWDAQLMISDSSRSVLRNAKPTATAMILPCPTSWTENSSSRAPRSLVVSDEGLRVG